MGSPSRCKPWRHPPLSVHLAHMWPYSVSAPHMRSTPAQLPPKPLDPHGPHHYYPPDRKWCRGLGPSVASSFSNLHWQSSWLGAGYPGSLYTTHCHPVATVDVQCLDELIITCLWLNTTKTLLYSLLFHNTHPWTRERGERVFIQGEVLILNLADRKADYSKMVLA